MSAMAPQIANLTIVYLTVYSDADQRKHQSSASLAFVRGIHRWPVNSPHKRPVTRKMFPFDDLIMPSAWYCMKYQRLVTKRWLFTADHILFYFLPTLTWSPRFCFRDISKFLFEHHNQSESTSNYCKIWIMSSHKAFEKSFYFFDDSHRNSTNLSLCSNSNHNYMSALS